MRTLFFCTLIALTLSFNGFAQKDSITIQNLSFNTKNDHFGISYYKNEQLVVAGNSVKSNGKIKTYKKIPLFILYKSKVGFKGEITDYQPLEMEKGATRFNVASCTFSADKQFIYVTTNFEPKVVSPQEKAKPNRLRIIRGEYLEGKGWGKFKVLPFCNEHYSFGQPSISPDGKTLYYVSSIKGSKGVTDIYKVSILENNTYGEPVQLGAHVNSKAKELYPYEGADGYLYYSAKKRGGVGRLDVYRSKILDDGTCGVSELLPAPINSPNDDYGFVINKDFKTGYFTSNRKGGKGGADVYSFKFN